VIRLDDESVLSDTPLPILDLTLWLKQEYYRSGREGVLALFVNPPDLGPLETILPPGLAEPQAEPAAPPAPEPARISPPMAYPGEDEDLPDPGLSAEQVGRLKAIVVQRGYTGVQELLDQSAARSPHWVSKHEVETAIGMTPSYLRSQLRSLTWAMEQLGRRDWPVIARRWGGSFFYRCHPAFAELWKAAE
jgi:hypothetical protein